VRIATGSNREEYREQDEHEPRHEKPSIHLTGGIAGYCFGRAAVDLLKKPRKVADRPRDRAQFGRTTVMLPYFYCNVY